MSGDEIRPRENDQVRALLRSLEGHAPGERGHAERVAVYAVATGESLGMSDEELVALRRAGQLHDIGKVRVDPRLLQKSGRLSDAEWEALRLHASLAERVLESLEFLQAATPMIRHHHERWDGTGYPDGLAGEEIPLGARILAVAEAFDALTTNFPFHRGIPEAEALEELRRNAGSQFDPAAVEALAKVQPLIQPIRSAMG
jgi:HD-GYP domain-containing protein (c-di-GMP phosphodiesterase class II)